MKEIITGSLRRAESLEETSLEKVLLPSKHFNLSAVCSDSCIRLATPSNGKEG